MVLNSSRLMRGIALAELRNCLVFLELGLPGGRIERRHDAGDRLPFDDGQAGFGEPRGAADDQRRDDQRCDRKQPQPDGAAAALQVMSDGGHVILSIGATLGCDHRLH